MSYVIQHKDPSWVRYAKQRISKNKNFLMFISGPTGSGKSYASLSIAAMMDPEFNMSRVVFSAKELMDLINSGTLHKGSVIVWEEAGVGLSNRNWFSVTNKVIGFLMQTFRHRCFILIMNAPYMDFADASLRKLFHAELQTISIDFKEKKVKLKPQLIQYNSRIRKFYYKYLRVLTAKGAAPIKRWSIPKPEQELLQEYEKRKRAYTDGLNEEISTEIRKVDQANKNKDQLPMAQREVLDLIKQGHTFSEVASIRGTTPRSISATVDILRRKGYDMKAIYESGKLKRYAVKGPEEN